MYPVRSIRIARKIQKEKGTLIAALHEVGMMPATRRFGNTGEEILMKASKETKTLFKVVLKSDGCLYWIDGLGLDGLDNLHSRFPTDFEPLAIELENEHEYEQQ